MMHGKCLRRRKVLIRAHGQNFSKSPKQMQRRSDTGSCVSNDTFPVFILQETDPNTTIVEDVKDCRPMCGPLVHIQLLDNV